MAGADPLLDADGRVLDRMITAAEPVREFVERVLADAGVAPGAE